MSLLAGGAHALLRHNAVNANSPAGEPDVSSILLIRSEDNATYITRTLFVPSTEINRIENGQPFLFSLLCAISFYDTNNKCGFFVIVFLNCFSLVAFHTGLLSVV